MLLVRKGQYPMITWQDMKRYSAQLIISLLLVACNRSDAVTSVLVKITPVEQIPTDVVTPSTQATINEPITSATHNHSHLCPEPGEDTKLYLSEEDGYCFLYPADFEQSKDWPGYGPGNVSLAAPQHDPGQSVYFYVQVMYNGQAVEGETAQTYADKWQTIHNLSGVILPTTADTIGGEQAIIVQNMRGAGISDPYLNQTAFVISHNQKYRIALHNADGWAQAFEEQAQVAWETITSSIVFFPPGDVQETITANQVCPHPGEDTQLLVNEAQGFCFLYPSDFEPDQQTTGGLSKNLVIDTVDGMEIRPQLGFVVSGAAQGLTLADIAQHNGVNSVQEITIDGQPAITFLDEATVPGPVYTGRVIKNGLVYSIWVSPYDPERYPEAVNDLDRIWQTVTDSLRFFSPVW